MCLLFCCKCLLCLLISLLALLPGARPHLTAQQGEEDGQEHDPVHDPEHNHQDHRLEERQEQVGDGHAQEHDTQDGRRAALDDGIPDDVQRVYRFLIGRGFLEAMKPYVI